MQMGFLFNNMLENYFQKSLIVFNLDALYYDN